MTEDKYKSIVNCIKSDLNGYDLKLSLFISSLVNHSDSRAVPFPPSFIQNGSKDFDTLMLVVERIPPLAEIPFITIDDDDEVINFLYWIFVEIRGPVLESQPKVAFMEIMGLTRGHVGSTKMPSHIFKVVQPKNSLKEERFQELRKEFKSSFAFHGSKIFNFHCILHTGLQQHLNKNALFYEGLYLSTELSVSLPYSSYNKIRWDKSNLGDSLSCVALCELIENPLYAKRCQKERGIGRGKHMGMPEQYIVVTNNDAIQLRYLLVYAKGKNHKNQNSQQNSIWNFVFSKTFLAMCYLLFLFMIGFNDTHYMRYLKRVFTQKINSGIESIRLLMFKK